MFVWPVAALLIAVQAAGAFAIERRRHSLDVLLTTPMSSAQIVRQKAAALVRLGLILVLPLLIVVLTKAWWQQGYDRFGSRILGADDTVLYLAASLLAIFIERS